MTSTVQARPLVALHGIQKCYGKVTALADLALKVFPGEIVALLGPNGAGKTTAVEIMTGLKRPDKGVVQVFGLEPNHAAARQRTGVMLQVSGVPETLKVREHLDLFSRYYPNPMPLSNVLTVAGLEAFANRPYGKLSGGQQRRLQFALSICGQPELVFLDEPTTGLDVESRRAMWKQIRSLTKAGAGIVLTTHYLEEADKLADRIIVIDRGRVIAEGSPSEIKAHAKGKQVRCRTGLSASRLRSLPGVANMHLEDNRFECLTHAPEETVRALLNEDENLTDLEVSGAQLEDAFIHLTNSHKEVA